MRTRDSRAPQAQRSPAAAAAAGASATVEASPRLLAQRQRIGELLGGAEADSAPDHAAASAGASSGLPAGLRAGIESVSGQALPEVRVHYGSRRPAQIQAHAFTQGSDIHLGPGQERHLAHEAWHVVQQAQGRVAPTLRGPQGTPINDDPALEREADVRGAQASAAAQRMAAAPGGAVRTAGPLAAAGAVQGQFFEKAEDGTYTWHDEAADGSYHLLPETRRYYNWYNPLGLAYGAYPVYTRGAVDRSGKLVSGGLSPQETQAVLNVFQTIQGTPYEHILHALEQRIVHHLGPSTLAQFYKGAHIVFEDNGQMYHDIFELGRPVAKLRKQTWGEWFHGDDVKETPGNLLPSTTRGPGVGARRPEKRETSHYGQDALPQLGIDLPGQLSGHLLVGIVPNDPYQNNTSAGHTFVQTEMYGFKNFSDHYLGHGQGFFWNFVASHQSGLVGYCKYSEKSRTEIREQDNPHVIQGRFSDAAPVQRKIAFDAGDPTLEVDTTKAFDPPGLRKLIGRVAHKTLVETGAVIPTAAEVFAQSIVAEKRAYQVERDGQGQVRSDFDADVGDRKSVFELYRQRYRLQGVIEDWSRLIDAQHRHLYLDVRELIQGGRHAGALGALAKTKDDGYLQAAATSLYDDLQANDLGDAGAGFLDFILENFEAIGSPKVQRMFLPLVMRRLSDRAVHERVAAMKGPERKQPYGKHHGLAYSLGVTSVLNYVADTFIEGFNPKTTSFSAFAIRPPHLGMKEVLATGHGGAVLADGWYMYIVDGQLQMLYFPTNNYVVEDKDERSKVFAQYIPHTVLSGGADVWAAGTFLVRDGRFALVDNGSGHYRPASASLNVVRGLLNGMGYPTADTRFVEFANTVETGERDKILPNVKDIEIGTVKKTGLTMDRPPRSPEVETMLTEAKQAKNG